MTLPIEAIAAILSDPLLPAEFAALCDCGGRLAGTASERRALELLRGLGQAASGRACTSVPVRYDGWRANEAELLLLPGGPPVPLACTPLLRSVSTEGLEAEVLPAGRATPEELAALGDTLHGRIALVHHEYMFGAGRIHRRQKYSAALAAGAVGFLIAGPLPAAAVAGSSGRRREPKHKREAAAIVRAEQPGGPVSISSEIVAEIGEYARFMTTCANTYVQPLMAT